MKPNEYQCANCRGIFEKGRSDDEAKIEAEEIFGQNPANGGMAIVCDDCFNKLMYAHAEPAHPKNLLEDEMKEVDKQVGNAVRRLGEL